MSSISDNSQLMFYTTSSLIYSDVMNNLHAYKLKGIKLNCFFTIGPNLTLYNTQSCTHYACYYEMTTAYHDPSTKATPISNTNSAKLHKTELKTNVYYYHHP